MVYQKLFHIGGGFIRDHDIGGGGLKVYRNLILWAPGAWGGLPGVAWPANGTADDG